MQMIYMIYSENVLERGRNKIPLHRGGGGTGGGGLSLP